MIKFKVGDIIKIRKNYTRNIHSGYHLGRIDHVGINSYTVCWKAGKFIEKPNQIDWHWYRLYKANNKKIIPLMFKYPELFR